MTPKTTTANKLSNPMISNVVTLSPPYLLWLGGLAVPLLLGYIIAWVSPIVNPQFLIFPKILFLLLSAGALSVVALVLYIYPASAVHRRGLFPFSVALQIGRTP